MVIFLFSHLLTCKNSTIMWNAALLSLILHLSFIKCFAFFKFNMSSQKSDMNNSIRTIYIKFIIIITRLGPEGRKIPPSSRERSISVRMYLWYCSFRNGEVNGLTPEGLVSRALYRRDPIGFTGISCTAIFHE